MPYRQSRVARLKPSVVAKTDGFCWYCGLPFDSYERRYTADHIVAKINGGTDDLDNLVPCCARCNGIKGERGVEYLRYRLYLESIAVLYERGCDFSGVFRFHFEGEQR